MNELNDAFALIPKGDPDLIRRRVADYQAARSGGMAESQLAANGVQWDGDSLAFTLKLFADVKSEILAGSPNDELRE